MKIKQTLAILIAAVLALSSLLFTGCNSSATKSLATAKPVSEGKITPPITNEAINEKYYNYEDIILQFQTAGFTNISTRTYLKYSSDEGETKEVSVNGNTDFSTTDEFPTDSKVVVTYYIQNEDDNENSIVQHTSTPETTAAPKTTVAPSSTPATTSKPTSSTNTDITKYYSDNLAKYKALGEIYRQKLTTVNNSIGNTYQGYVANKSALEQWYNELKTDYTSLFDETNTLIQNYISKIKNEIPASDYDAWDNALDTLYDNYYGSNGVFDTLYDDFYSSDGLFDEIYNHYYSSNGVLGSIPDNIEFKEWDNTTGDFYKSWDNATGDFFSNWDKATGNFFKQWDEASGYFYKEYLK